MTHVTAVVTFVHEYQVLPLETSRTLIVEPTVGVVSRVNATWSMFCGLLEFNV